MTLPTEAPGRRLMLQELGQYRQSHVVEEASVSKAMRQFARADQDILGRQRRRHERTIPLNQEAKCVEEQTQEIVGILAMSESGHS